MPDECKRMIVAISKMDDDEKLFYYSTTNTHCKHDAPVQFRVFLETWFPRTDEQPTITTAERLHAETCWMQAVKNVATLDENGCWTWSVNEEMQTTERMRMLSSSLDKRDEIQRIEGLSSCVYVNNDGDDDDDAE